MTLGMTLLVLFLLVIFRKFIWYFLIFFVFLVGGLFTMFGKLFGGLIHSIYGLIGGVFGLLFGGEDWTVKLAKVFAFVVVVVFVLFHFVK